MSSSDGEKQTPTADEEKQQQQQQQQKQPLVPPSHAARTFFIPIPSTSVEMRQDWLERLNLFLSLSAAASVLAGACAILLPLFLSITVQTLTRWILVAVGIVALLHFLLTFGAPATTAFLLIGVLHLGVGLWMVISSSTHEDEAFFYIMAGWFVVHGILKFLLTWQLRNLTTWPTVLVSAVLSIIFAAVHFAFTSNWGLTFFSIIFGADLALTGLAFFFIAFMAFLASRASSTQEPLLEEASRAHA